MATSLILVLDIDETMLSIEPLFYLEKFCKNFMDWSGKILIFGNKRHEYYAVLRPQVREFLQTAQKYFKLVAWSTASRAATLQKLKAFELEKFFLKIYCAEDLIDNKKHLNKIAQDFDVFEDNIVAIDDRPELYTRTDNVIVVRPWLIGSSVAAELQENRLFNALELALTKVNLSQIISSEAQIAKHRTI